MATSKKQADKVKETQSAPKKPTTATPETTVEQPPIPEPPKQVSADEVPAAIADAQANTQDGDVIGDLAPGTGIDTDGDGNANLVVEPEEEKSHVHVDHEDDYKGKVKISGNMADVHDKKEAKKLVEASNIHDHHKQKMYQQIKCGQFQPPYVETFKRIRDADSRGTTYRPGIEGI